MFADTVLKIEGDDITAIEIMKHLDDLENTLKLREEDEFLSPLVAEEKDTLIGFGYDAELLRVTCKTFFGNV